MFARALTTMTRIGLVAGCLLMVSACPEPGVDDPDAGDQSGLGFLFTTSPEIGDDVGGTFEIVVDTVSLQLSDFRAIGDAAPGDARTTVASLDLDWAAGQLPDVLLFSQAPLGFYSRLEASVDRTIITGTVTVNAVTQAFEIDDSAAWSVTIPLSEVELEAGSLLELNLVFRLDGVVTAVPWDTVVPDGGRLRVRDGDPWIDAVRQAMAAALAVEG